MTNPLLQKYEELYGKKEEPPQIVEEPKKITTKLTTHDIDSIEVQYDSGIARAFLFSLDASF